MNKFFEQLSEGLSRKSPVYIKIKAVPKSPKTEVAEQMADGTYKIRVAAPAEGGRANAELIRFLKKGMKAAGAGVSAGEIVIVSGQTDRVKLIRISA
jgi:uncharacterized protein (TIGR00251 family)